jgi:uncharacterized protein (DUF58 family)
MKYSVTFGLLALSRVYAVVALIVVIVFTPLIAIPIPLLVLLLYFYVEFGRHEARYKVMLSLFLALSLPLLFKPMVGGWISPVFALPVIPVLDHNLIEFGSSTTSVKEDFEGLKPTGLCLVLAICLAVIGLIALALGVWCLAISSALLAIYLGTIIGLVIRRMPKAPCRADIATHRVVAGDFIRITVRLVNQSKTGGHLWLKSLHKWFWVRPQRLTLDRPTLETSVHFTPPLAGPSTVECMGTFLDPRGLLQRRFKMELVNLFVIPRARYAEWLARRYLEISTTGSLETMSSSSSARHRTSVRGLECYGVRPYQPGDRAKTIDWKRTLSLQQVVVKEFLDMGVESAIILVNLSANDEEEKDKVAYSLITTAITLAREHIPSALAAYTDKEVVLTTRQLDPREALIEALSLAREIRVSLSPLRYLAVPDVIRLRGNIGRLKQSEDGPASRLAELLDMEYMALSETVKHSTATKALNSTLKVVKAKANVIIISGLNHDAEAIAFNQYTLKGKGYQVLPVDLDSMRRKIPVPRRRLPV